MVDNEKDDNKISLNPDFYLRPDGWEGSLSLPGIEWLTEKSTTSTPAAKPNDPPVKIIESTRREYQSPSLPPPLPIAKLGVDGKYHPIAPPVMPSQNTGNPILNAAKEAVQGLNNAVKAIPAELKDAGGKIKSGLHDVSEAASRLPTPSIVGGIKVEIGGTTINNYGTPPADKTGNSSLPPSPPKPDGSRGR